MRIDVSLNLPRDAATISMARHICSCALHEVGASKSTIADVELALSEACANVIEHAVSGEEYEVRVDLDAHTCRIRVIDRGPGLDPGAVPTDMPRAILESGRGIALMRALVDEIDFEPDPGRGTSVCLVKTLDGSPDVVDLRGDGTSS